MSRDWWKIDEIPFEFHVKYGLYLTELNSLYTFKCRPPPPIPNFDIRRVSSGMKLANE